MGIFGRIRKAFGKGDTPPPAQTPDQHPDQTSDQTVSPTPSDGPSPGDNRKVIEAMGFVASNDTPEHRTRLYRAILDSQMLLPCDEETAKKAMDAGEIQSDEELSLVVIQNPQGQMILPVFTDEKSLALWSAKIPAYLWMDGRDLLSLVKRNNSDALAINPAGPVGGVIDAEHLQNLLALLDPQAQD